ncbi:MAG: hypothetical protein QXT53_07545 [Ignisphaera sp.]
MAWRSMSLEESSRKGLVNELYKVLKSHYIALYAEDKFFEYLRKRLCVYSDEWCDVVYARRNESTRIGYVKALINDLHRVVYSDFAVVRDVALEKLELAWHGRVREQVSEDLSTGIDIVYLIQYPYGGKSVVLPLFIAAKSQQNDFTKVKPSEIINRHLMYFGKFLEEKHGYIKVAMESIPHFVRGVVTGIETESKRGDCLVEKDRMRIYTDMVCGALNIVLRDIQEIYNEIINDQELRSLDLATWIIVLLYVSRKLDLVVLSSAEPPKPPYGGLSQINDIVSEVMERLRKDVAGERTEIPKTLGKQIENAVKEVLSNTEKIERRGYRRPVPA